MRIPIFVLCIAGYIVLSSQCLYHEMLKKTPKIGSYHGHGDPVSTHRSLPLQSRDLSSRNTYYHQLAAVAPPPGHSFCPGSQEYYCENSATCVMSESGGYICRTTRTTTIRKIPITSSNRYGGSTSIKTTPILTSSDRYGGSTFRKTPTRTYTNRYGTRRYYPSGGSSNYYPTYGGSDYYPRRPIITAETDCGTGKTNVAVTNRDNSTSYTCEDIDECESSPCDGDCENTYGSFRCSCGEGYEKHGTYHCVDVDECTKYPWFCDHDCVNTNGSYKCMCQEGYIEEPNDYCRDINECEANPCEVGEVCFNIWGSYECEEPHPCPAGYHRLNTTNVVNGDCRIDRWTDDMSEPHAISYRKIGVESRLRYSYSTLGSITISGDPRYRHRYFVRAIEGKSQFGYKREEVGSNLKLSLYNVRPLPAGTRSRFVLDITDYPSLKSYRYGTRSRSPKTMKRRLDMTVVAMSPGGRDHGRDY